MSNHPFLTDFDLDLIRLLAADFVLLSGKQIQALFPQRSSSNIRYRLHRLKSLGFISCRLFPAHYDVPKLPLYFVGPKAAEPLSLERSDPTFIAHRKRAIYLRERAIPHFLLIQSVYSKFLVETRHSNSCQLTSWIQPYDPLWNTFREYGLGFRPDGYGELHIQTLIQPFFLEVDRGDEHTPLLKTKFDRYNDYARSGNFQHHFGISAFRLLFITTSPKRVHKLLRLTASHTPHLFWFATFQDFLDKPLLDPYWSASGSDVIHSLSTPL